MGLSDVKGEAAFELAARVVGPIARIAADKDIAEAYRVDKPDKVDPREFIVGAIGKVAPVAMTKYRAELCEIFAAEDGVGAGEWAEGADGATVYARTCSLLTDPMFLRFLR